MRIRATTSFPVGSSNISMLFEDVRDVVWRVIAQVESERGLAVDEAAITQSGPGTGSDLVVGVDIVFLSDSYGEVDEAMLWLTRRIAGAENELTGCPIDLHETRLVPAG